MQEVLNVRSALCVDGLMDLFNGMSQKLEKIQKSLDDYLEQKRQQFPRFYFLSSDDLLDILGQAKDPRNVQVEMLLTSLFRNSVFPMSMRYFICVSI
mgnify:CR=1 FL=1